MILQEEADDENALIHEVENGHAKRNGVNISGIEENPVTVKPAPSTGIKFGWIKGVLVGCGD